MRSAVSWFGLSILLALAACEPPVDPVIPCRATISGISQDGTTMYVSGDFVGGFLSANVYTSETYYQHLSFTSGTYYRWTANVRTFLPGTFRVTWAFTCSDKRAAEDSTGHVAVKDAPSMITIQ